MAPALGATPIRALVVEDNRDICATIQAALKSAVSGRVERVV